MLSSKKTKITLLLTILFSSLLLSVTMFRNGLSYDFGLGFWGPNGHDGIWHLSVINQLKQNFPPQNPVFSGETLSNYHWGFNLIVALISKFTTINSSVLYFQILPIIFSIILGLLSYKLAYLLTRNSPISILFVILNYFSSSWGWIVTLFKSGQIGGESLFWSMQSASTLLNPPYALSLIILFSGLILWLKYHNSNSAKWGIIIGILLGLLSFIKVYSAILIGLSLSIYWLIDLVRNKKFSAFNFSICISMGLVSFLLLKILGVLDNVSLMEFKPFWFTHSLIESIDKFYWPRLASFRYNQTNFIVSIIIELFLIFIFLVGNLGLKILGLVNYFINLFNKKFKDFDLLMLPFLAISFLIPMLFVQKGTAWNTIQFFYYFSLIINFYFATYLIKVFPKRIVFIILFIFITCFGSYGTLKDYFGNPPPASLPTSEIKALSYLSKLPTGYVLTYPYDKYIKNNFTTPIPLYMYETTAYVSAFSQKPVYLEDEMNLDITGFDWQFRRNQSLKFYSSADKYFSRGFLVDNNIKYIYLLKDQKFVLSESDLEIDKIYDSDGVRIFSVRR